MRNWNWNWYLRILFVEKFQHSWAINWNVLNIALTSFSKHLQELLRNNRILNWRSEPVLVFYDHPCHTFPLCFRNCTFSDLNILLLTSVTLFQFVSTQRCTLVENLGGGIPEVFVNFYYRVLGNVKASFQRVPCWVLLNFG